MSSQPLPPEPVPARSPWRSRLAVLLLFVILIALILLLFPWQRPDFTHQAALDVLEELIAKHASIDDAELILGKPSLQISFPPDGSATYAWHFYEESLLSMTRRTVQAHTKDGRLLSAGFTVGHYQGSQLWSLRWQRLNTRLGWRR